MESLPALEGSACGLSAESAILRGWLSPGSALPSSACALDSEGIGRFRLCYRV
jgi:hypothetical protein